MLELNFHNIFGRVPLERGNSPKDCDPSDPITKLVSR